MSFIDFIPCALLSVATAYFVYLGWYPQAVFTAMFFVLLIVNVALHIISQPLPRFVIGEFSITPEEEEK